MLRILVRQFYSKERKEVLNYQKPRLIPQITHQPVNCMVIHPVFYPNQGPEIELYAAEEAVGLAKALFWNVTRGPFWQEEYTEQIRMSQGRNSDGTAKEKEKDSSGRALANRKFMIKSKMVNDDRSKEELKAEGWSLSNEVSIKDGEYIYSPYFKGTAYNGGVFMDMESSGSDDEVYDEWKNKIIRNSIAKSSLMKIKKIHGTYFFSRGRLVMLGDYILQNNVNALYVNHELSALQQRNLEKQLTTLINGGNMKQANSNVEVDESDYDSDAQSSQSDMEQVNAPQETRTIKVFDRYTMILQIFAKRAKTGLAKLQIELSFLNFARTKLIRSGTAFQSLSSIFEGDLMSANEINLEVVSAKQRNAKGKMSGAGETQLEIQRRNIRDQEAKINRMIDIENQQRGQKQLKRKNLVNNVPTIALIGYTNAGKSALMNCILQKDVVESNDMLFQTLQTTTRKINLVSGQKAILLDTIGFISDLPHDLIESFKSTLDEVSQADLVLHIRDISHPCTNQQKQTVLDVLRDLGYSQDFYSNRMIEVWNKIDLLKEPIDYDKMLQIDYPVVPISALMKINTKQLIKVIEDKCNALLGKQMYHFKHSLQDHGDRLRWLYQNGNISGTNNERHGEESLNGIYQAFVEFDVVIDEVTYNRYMVSFDIERPRERERKGMPPSDWNKKS